MGCSVVDKHVAKRKMRIKNCNYCLSFVTTLWKGEVIMLTMNNISKEVIDVFCNQIIEPEDFQELENLVRDFIFGGDQWVSDEN